MRPHEIREIHFIGSAGEGDAKHLYWRVKFRRYGIVDAIDYIELLAVDEVDAFRRATKKLESIR